jgi:hypothetical protein
MMQRKEQARRLQGQGQWASKHEHHARRFLPAVQRGDSGDREGTEVRADSKERREMAGFRADTNEGYRDAACKFPTACNTS